MAPRPTRFFLTLRLLLLLLAASVRPSKAEPSAKTCPPCPGGAEAESCAGKARPPACCSSGEAPADHRRPCLQEETRRKEPGLPSGGYRDNWSTILVFIIIASIALVSVGIFFFYPQIRTCLRSCLQQPQQEIQPEDAAPPLGISVINLHVYEGALVSPEPRACGVEGHQATSDSSPVVDGKPIVQCHLASVGASKDQVVILSPEVPQERDLSVMETTL